MDTARRKRKNRAEVQQDIALEII